ncbi:MULTISPECIES: hypothetical protein [unclassified Colwellia]|uniref:hypothetical protein n=1 Tax=unclassified Colwellia TaxID=196834 RepID=UPI0015F7090A|nr:MULTISPECIES: hypothetical protein [unclassified Colwellia]MBA6346713.1 hypothetical protein [Colwellia sp. BRX8-9]MBA6353534.1 hypothetical protein [Colwellia sp. BRX9-1]MBA6357061.1 hypothetical protein [Colwellia sp. BRX8-3]MBA6361073.1 hypothetical protein [Colwellia sp. BRX8-6]MBA6369058.1 hypothetical protein [Colwellia sp. BRX8-5]
MANTILKSEASETKNYLGGNKPSEFYHYLADIKYLFKATNTLTGDKLLKIIN